MLPVSKHGVVTFTNNKPEPVEYEPQKGSFVYGIQDFFARRAFKVINNAHVAHFFGIDEDEYYATMLGSGIAMFDYIYDGPVPDPPVPEPNSNFDELILFLRDHRTDHYLKAFNGILYSRGPEYACASCLGDLIEAYDAKADANKMPLEKRVLSFPW